MRQLLSGLSIKVQILVPVLFSVVLLIGGVTIGSETLEEAFTEVSIATEDLIVHKEELSEIGSCGKRNTGTSVHFKPDPKYFDSFKFSVSRLLHLLKAKAVLCPGLSIKFKDKVNKNN